MTQPTPPRHGAGPAHLVAAPDKFRGTATASEVAASAAGAARRCGWTADEMPLADGGEGTLAALLAAGRGELRQARVTGPLGCPVDAAWLVIADTSGTRLPAPLVPGRDPTAVVEAAAAAGRALLPQPRGDEPLNASTAGVGELVVAAAVAGARQVVVGVGGTATTDGGAGARDALCGGADLGDLPLVVACDVRTRFTDAARVFGPQKGAGPDAVARLTHRLEGLAERYLAEDGVDVRSLDGGGAGGGLAGGLAALGAAVVSGFSLVAELVDLEGRLGRADLVVTGEGRLDATSFDGKVVGGVLAACGGEPPALCVVGAAAPGAHKGWAGRRGPVELVELTRVVGATRARTDVVSSIHDVMTRRCCPC